MRSLFAVSVVLILLIGPVVVVSNVLAEIRPPPPPPPQHPGVVVVVQLVQVNVIVNVTSQVTDVIPTVLIVAPAATSPLALPSSADGLAGMDAIGLLTGSVAMLAAAVYVTIESKRREGLTSLGGSLSAGKLDVGGDKLSAGIPSPVVLTKDVMKSQIQRAFQQAKPKVQGKIRGVTPQQLDLLWQSREFQQVTDMLAQDVAAFIAKHMRPGVIQGPAPQPVSRGQWYDLLQQHLQSARLRGVSEATLRSNQTEVNNQVRTLCDALLEIATQQLSTSEYYDLMEREREDTKEARDEVESKFKASDQSGNSDYQILISIVKAIDDELGIFNKNAL